MAIAGIKKLVLMKSSRLISRSYNFCLVNKDEDNCETAVNYARNDSVQTVRFSEAATLTSQVIQPKKLKTFDVIHKTSSFIDSKLATS